MYTIIRYVSDVKGKQGETLLPVSCEREGVMAKNDKGRRDVWFGTEGITLMNYLATQEGRPGGEIARKALFEYASNRVGYRDIIRDAVLDLMRALLPDGQYDPVDDPREQEAVHILGVLLQSAYAAEGIAAAITLLFAENVLEMSTLHIPLVGDSATIEGEEGDEPEAETPHEEQ